jgi:hypothetical protein
MPAALAAAGTQLQPQMPAAVCNGTASGGLLLLLLLLLLLPVALLQHHCT